MYASSAEETVAPTAVPASEPTGTPRPPTVEASPRRSFGTWSATTAMRMFSPMLTVPCTRNQPISRPATVDIQPSRTREARVATPPYRIQGERRPHRPRVRSDMAPTIGGTHTDAMALTPVTSPNAESLPTGSAASTWVGSRTCSAAPTAA